MEASPYASSSRPQGAKRLTCTQCRASSHKSGHCTKQCAPGASMLAAGYGLNMAPDLSALRPSEEPAARLTGNQTQLWQLMRQQRPGWRAGCAPAGRCPGRARCACSAQGPAPRQPPSRPRTQTCAQAREPPPRGSPCHITVLQPRGQRHQNARALWTSCDCTRTRIHELQCHSARQVAPHPRTHLAATMPTSGPEKAATAPSKHLSNAYTRERRASGTTCTIHLRMSYQLMVSTFRASKNCAQRGLQQEALHVSAQRQCIHVCSMHVAMTQAQRKRAPRQTWRCCWSARQGKPLSHSMGGLTA